MMYVSLPVHTQPLVVAGQIRNFAHFFPEATVVLHVAAKAKFEMPQLLQALDDAGCGNALLNPERVMTSWGSILRAHVSNVHFIRRQGNATRICLHASNDMLVRAGLAARLKSGANFFNLRIVRPGTYWRFGQPALEDECLRKLCKRLGATEVVGSQVEGSCYEAGLLFDIADIIASVPEQPASIPYPREEVWLSTIACALGAQAHGCPYVFSELHRFDRVFWKVLRHLNPVIGTDDAASHFMRRVVEYGMIKSGFHRISKTCVNRIANDDYRRLARYEWMSDGNNEWRVFDPHGLFGVKRVPRRPKSRLRTYIDAMAPDPCVGRRMQIDQQRR